MYVMMAPISGMTFNFIEPVRDDLVKSVPPMVMAFAGGLQQNSNFNLQRNFLNFLYL